MSFSKSQHLQFIALCYKSVRSYRAHFEEYLESPIPVTESTPKGIMPVLRKWSRRGPLVLQVSAKCSLLLQPLKITGIARWRNLSIRWFYIGWCYRFQLEKTLFSCTTTFLEPPREVGLRNDPPSRTTSLVWVNTPLCMPWPPAPSTSTRFWDPDKGPLCRVPCWIHDCPP